MPPIIVPNIFYEDKTFNMLNFDDVTCIEYKHNEIQNRNALCLTNFTFVVMLSGKKIIHIGSNERYVEKGSAFFANKGAYIFSEIASNPGGYESLVFSIGDNFMKHFIDILGNLNDQADCAENETSDIFRITMTPLLQSSVESIIPLFIHKSSNTKALLRLKLEEILLHLAESDQREAFLKFLKHLQNSSNMSLSQIMEKNYVKPMTVEAFAHLSGRSLTAFKNDFRQIYNMPPKKWINKKRLERAKALVSTTGMSITEICFECGFESPSYFSHLFRKEFGCSPTAVKKAS